MPVLALSFFIIALLYSIVGFGGGSSYIALLSFTDTPYHLIPKIALICNLLVVTGGTYHFYKKGHISLPLVLPFVLSSVPMAYLGGLYRIEEQTFYLLLAISLFLSAIRLLIIPVKTEDELKNPSTMIALIAGATLGLLSGIVGIGGGIFLSPVLIQMGWARSKTAAAVASCFILVNSLAGLAGQFTKNHSLADVFDYFPLFIAVVLAGQIGSRLGSHHKFSPLWIQRGTALLILIASIRLLQKIL